MKYSKVEMHESGHLTSAHDLQGAAIHSTEHTEGQAPRLGRSMRLLAGCAIQSD